MSQLTNNMAAFTIQWRHNIYSVMMGNSLNMNLKTVHLKHILRLHELTENH